MTAKEATDLQAELEKYLGFDADSEIALTLQDGEFSIVLTEAAARKVLSVIDDIRVDPR